MAAAPAAAIGTLHSSGGLLYAGVTGVASPGTSEAVYVWDGATWSPLPPVPEPVSAVHSLVTYQGHLLAGAGTPASGLRTFLWDGIGWSTFGVGVGRDLAVVGSTVYALSPGAYNGFARWDGVAWSAVQSDLTVWQCWSCINPWWNAGGSLGFLESQGGRVYLGGSFDMLGIGGSGWPDVTLTGSDNLASFGDSTWQNQPGLEGYTCAGPGANRRNFAVTAMDESDDVLWIANSDGRVGSFPAGGAAQLLPGVFNGTITGVARFAGQPVAIGAFRSVDGQTTGNIAQFDGAAWHSVGGAPTNAPAETVTSLGHAGAVPLAGELGRLRSYDGDHWTVRLTTPFLGAAPTAMLETGDGLYVGAEVGSSGPGIRVVLLPNAPSSWSSTELPGIDENIWGLGCSLRSFQVFGGQLHMGGSFWRAAGTDLNNIARWDGAAWRPLAGGLTHDDFLAWCNALAQFGGQLIAGGVFTRANGSVVNNIAAWDGSVWAPLGSGTNGDVNALAVYDGALIVGGSFSDAGGTGASKLARWDGTAWHTFGQPDGVVKRLAAIHDKLLVAGGFTHIDGQELHGLALWDGTSWSDLAGGVDASADHVAFTGSSLFVAGGFNLAGDVSSSGIAAWLEPWVFFHPTGAPQLLHSGFALSISPNPMHGQTRITYALSATGEFVALEVFDARGRLVRNLGVREQAAGSHQLLWDGLDANGRELAAGTYYVRLTSQGQVRAEKVMLLR